MTEQSPLSCSKSDLESVRLKSIAQILKPLMKAAHYHEVCGQANPERDGVVLSAHDSRTRYTHYSDRRIKSNVARFLYFQYYEVWQPVPKTKLFVPKKTYLHLFATDRSNENLQQVACVHSDPIDDMVPGLERQWMHKRGPHVHVSAAVSPLDHCHIPLYIRQLDDVLSSLTKLTDAMGEAIDLVVHEIEEVYKKKTK